MSALEWSVFAFGVFREIVIAPPSLSEIDNRIEPKKLRTVEVFIPVVQHR
jgi:hypothetical protein